MVPDDQWLNMYSVLLVRYSPEGATYLVLSTPYWPRIANTPELLTPPLI